MSKRLPYFQFEPAEYLAGDIMFCSYSAQGIFNTICALYWQKDCDLKYSQVIKRLGNEDLIKELISEKIIKVENDSIIINFLDEQYIKATEKSRVNSSNGSKGALKRWAKNSESNSEIIAMPLKNNSESIALREDKIREEEIKEDKIKNKRIVNKFTPPSQIEIIDYFNQNGYSNESAIKAFNYYEIGNWKDGKGNQVKNWKQKMQSVWFKEDNKIKQVNKVYDYNNVRGKLS